MTAGRDSRGLTTAFCEHHTLVKCPLHLASIYSLAVSLRNRQSREELTRQPDLHHRVVILQPPPSLDGGLDSQSLCLDAWFFNCPAKASMLFLCNRDSSCALFLKTYKTPFSFSSRNHTTGCYLHQFLPLQKFLNEISICCLLLSQYPTRIFSCVHTELLSFHFCFCYFPRSEAVRSISSSPVASTRTDFTRTTKFWKLCDWSIVSEIFFFLLRTCIFCLLQKCVILKI